MSYRNGRAQGRDYVSYSDVLDWQRDFARTHRVLLDWKITLRTEEDGKNGFYVTLFVRQRATDGGRLIRTEVVRFGAGSDAATLPGAMIRALIQADRELSGKDQDEEWDDGATEPSAPLV